MENKLFYRKVPFVKFPQEWEVKFLQGTDRKPIYFCIKKADAPNIVSVAVFINDDDLSWEVAVLQEHESGQTSITGWEAIIPIDETERLLRFINKKLYEDVTEKEEDVYPEE